MEKITKEIREMLKEHFAYHGEHIVELKKVMFGKPGDKEPAIRAKIHSGDRTFYVYCAIAYDSHNKPYVYEIVDSREPMEDEEADGA